MRGKHEGRPVPALSINHHLKPMVASSRSKRLRGHVAKKSAGLRRIMEAPEAAEKRRVVVTLVRGKRQRILDHDNAAIACKPAIDGLVDAGWLVDDKPKWCDYPRPQQVKGMDGVARLLFEISLSEE